MNKINSGIFGLVVADALGVPVEFKQRGTFKVDDMIGYGTYNVPPGTWSDDSSLTLATLDSLAKRKKVNLDDIMRNFSKWFYGCEFTPWGDVFDVGKTTAKAIENYYNGSRDVQTCGCGWERDNGNGALMRILPISFLPLPLDEKLMITRKVAALTHSHERNLTACEVYVSIADYLILDYPINAAVWSGIEKVKPSIEFNRLPVLLSLTESEIKSSGYVVDTLEAALWCLQTTDTYKDCVLKAVNLGDDTDTIAAVAGGLAGIHYGIGAIPYEWMKQIPRRDWIEKLCNQFRKKHLAVQGDF